MSVARARQLRKSMTSQEVKRWAPLRKLRPEGFHFRRQAPLEGYVLDFVCFKHRLIVEANGSQHGAESALRHDARRDAIFAASGFRTLRFWNSEIGANLHGVVETIILRARRARGGESHG
jgi:very-short-patch-repair endonuclease